MQKVAPVHEYDFSQAYAKNQIKGLWRMMTGFRLQYAGATASLAVSASAKTATFLLLRYFIDQVLGQGKLLPGRDAGADVDPHGARVPGVCQHGGQLQLLLGQAGCIHS